MSKLQVMVVIIIVFFVGGAGVYLLHTQKSNSPVLPRQGQQQSQVTVALTATSTSTLLTSTISQSSAQKQANMHIDTSSWQKYSDNILAISFSYPPTWQIKTGDYFGSVFTVAPDGVCQYIQNWLKNPQTCNDKTIRSFSPGLTILPPKPQGMPEPFVDQLQFIGPISGIGGSCDDCQKTTWNAVINGKSYALDTFTINPNPKVYPYHGILYTTFEPLDVKIPTGDKSMWKYFDIYLEASDQQTLNTELAILQSISF